jgi:conjugal transfer pilus assembly protein TraW
MAHFLIRCLGILILALLGLEAKDLGIQGHVFPIEEEDLLEKLHKQTHALVQEELLTMQKKVQQHYTTYLQEPKPVQGLQDAPVYRIFYVDPTLCVDREVKDHKGQLMISKNQCINPLTLVHTLETLLFFDATQPLQVEWARNQPQPVKWVLTKGRPLELEERENRPIYFDQNGMLVKKFGIQKLPAKVSQEGLKLKVEEIPLKRSLCID